MSRFLHVLMLSSILIGCASLGRGDWTPKELPNGFRDITWGMKKVDIHGLKFHHTDPSYGGIDLYTRDGDDLHLGSGVADKIFYGFWNDQLCDITIYVKDVVNWYGLKNAAFEKYGKGFQSNPYLENYYWSDNKTTIMLEYNKASDIGDLNISSNALSEKMQAWEKEKSKEGAKSL